MSFFEDVCRKNFSIKSSLELWQYETSLPSIPTFSRSLDDVLGCDGVRLGTVTELLGLPGVGKTQLCLQLCAAVQVPKALGGLEGEALFIDTNTNFTLHRFTEILKASMGKCQRILDNSDEIDLMKHLEKLHYVDAFGLARFKQALHEVPIFLQHNPNVRLIVIDSIGFPFKEGISEKQRTGALFTEMANLQRIAVERQIAVVLTNEMSTRLSLSGGEVVGALGDAWAHRSNTRLLLASSASADRTALLLQSNVAPQSVGTFQITPEGIRDIKENTR